MGVRKKLREKNGGCIPFLVREMQEDFHLVDTKTNQLNS